MGTGIIAVLVLAWFARNLLISAAVAENYRENRDSIDRNGNDLWIGQLVFVKLRIPLVTIEYSSLGHVSKSRTASTALAVPGSG